ncbi:unnamed protein product, partial [Dibothriocephalus latus]
MFPSECRNLYESGLARILVTHISLGIALLGIPANIFALIVLHVEKTCRSPTHILLSALAIEDIMIILFYSIYYIAMHYYESYNLLWLGFLRYIDTPLFYLVNWIKMIEIYTVVLLSLERYTAIRWPLKAARLCSVGRTKRGLLIITLFSGIFKLPNLILDYRVLRWSPACKDYKLVCSFVIPLSLLVFLNCGLITRIRRFEKQHKSGQWSLKRFNVPAAIATRKTPYEPRKPTSFVLAEKEGDCSDLPSPPHGTSNSHYSPLSLLKKPNPIQGNSREQSATLSIASPEQTHDGSQQEVSRSIVSSKSGRTSTASTKSRSILVTLVCVVTTFIICETPTTLCFLFEIWHLLTGIANKSRVAPSNSTVTAISAANSTDTQSANPYDLYYYAYPAALVLVLVGCASNFFIYILMGRRFRQTCIRLLVRFCCLKCAQQQRCRSQRNEEDSGFIRPLKHRRKVKTKCVCDSVNALTYHAIACRILCIKIYPACALVCPTILDDPLLGCTRCPLFAGLAR